MKSAWSPGACSYQGLVSGLCDSHKSPFRVLLPLPGGLPPSPAPC